MVPDWIRATKLERRNWHSKLNTKKFLKTKHKKVCYIKQVAYVLRNKKQTSKNEKFICLQ